MCKILIMTCSRHLTWLQYNLKIFKSSASLSPIVVFWVYLHWRTKPVRCWDRKKSRMVREYRWSWRKLTRQGRREKEWERQEDQKGILQRGWIWFVIENLVRWKNRLWLTVRRKREGVVLKKDCEVSTSNLTIFRCFVCTVGRMNMICSLFMVSGGNWCF